MTSTKPTLAFFGPTGGCANATLALALKGGYKCSALARTPEKLRKMLQENHQVPISTIDNNLTIIQGDVLNVSAVKQTFAPNGVPASIIISGLGPVSKLQFSLTNPVHVDNASICHDATGVMLQGLHELRREGVISDSQKPFFAVISTTGTQPKPRDVPYAYFGLYHMVLAIPHKDKRSMESQLAKAGKESGAEAPIRAFAIVRPTLLFDGESKGMGKIKSGWVVHPEAVNAGDKRAPGPAIGYSIRRNDVGLWIFEEIVKKSEKWENKAISLSY